MRFVVDSAPAREAGLVDSWMQSEVAGSCPGRCGPCALHAVFPNALGRETDFVRTSAHAIQIVRPNWNDRYVLWPTRRGVAAID